MKRKKNEEEMENFIDVFIRNYKKVPGFRSLVKLTFYIILIIIFLTVIAFSKDEKEDNNKKDNNTYMTTTVKVKNNLVYKDILDNVIKEKKDLYLEVKIHDSKYIIDAMSIKNEITGYFESNNETKRFKIKENHIYELKLDQETENDILFKDINLDFVIPANLINILKNNMSTKILNDNETIYTYNIEIDKIKYIIKTTVKENNLTNILITSENIEYKIVYE